MIIILCIMNGQMVMRLKYMKKIILSAITFWFKDEDAKEGKVWDYFND